MAYRVGVYFANTYAAITVKDWLSNTPCEDTKTGNKIENLPVNSSATLEVWIGQKKGVGGVIIYDTVAGVTPVPSDYKIPADLDDTGKITFPKSQKKVPMQSDLDHLDARIKALEQKNAGNEPGE